MKKAKKALFLLMIISLAILAVFQIHTLVTRDDTPPQIICPEGTLDVSINVTDEELLTGVTAQDDQDGELTAHVVVENLSSMGKGHTRDVTYAVADLSDNVSRAIRTIHYTDYEPPRILLEKPLRVNKRDAMWELLGNIHASSTLDGDLSTHVRYSFLDSAPIVDSGSYGLELRVSDSTGNSTVIPTTIEIYDPREETIPVELSDYILYLHVNDPFDPEDYLGPKEKEAPAKEPDAEDKKAAEDSEEKDSKKDDEDRRSTEKSSSGFLKKGQSLSVDSNVNTAVPGVYHVTYTVEQEKSDAYGKSRMIVVVEE